MGASGFCFKSVKLVKSVRSVRSVPGLVDLNTKQRGEVVARATKRRYWRITGNKGSTQVYTTCKLQHTAVRITGHPYVQEIAAVPGCRPKSTHGFDHGSDYGFETVLVDRTKLKPKLKM